MKYTNADVKIVWVEKFLCFSQAYLHLFKMHCWKTVPFKAKGKLILYSFTFTKNIKSVMCFYRRRNLVITNFKVFYRILWEVSNFSVTNLEVFNFREWGRQRELWASCNNEVRRDERIIDAIYWAGCLCCIFILSLVQFWFPFVWYSLSYI